MGSADILHELRIGGLPLPDDLLKEVMEDGFADSIREIVAGSDDTTGPVYDGRRHLWLYSTPAAVQGNDEIADDPNYYDRIPQEWFDEWEGKEITQADYTPEGCPESLPEDMRSFIMSSWDRFDKLKAYKQFWLYCEQARRWNSERTTSEDFARYSQPWIDYCLKEVHRCRINLLYALDRYVTIMDDSQPGGRRNYKASAPQALLCFLKNVGVSYVIIKGRQAAITSTEMAMAQVRTMTIRSYKGILTTDDVEDTGKNIFGDKFWSTKQHMPFWFQPRKVAAKSTLKVMYDFEAGRGKGDSKKSTSEFSVVASKDPQKINGTTPTDLYVDEAQNVDNLQKLIDERRPTQLAEVGGRLRVIRSSYVWGTGNVEGKGKGALEDLYKGIKANMVTGKDTKGWVALFFDAFCRPYMNKKTYFDKYREYVGEEADEARGRSMEEKEAMFASHYPMSDEDAFRGAQNGITSRLFIKKNLDRITEKLPGGCKRGRFHPIYDYSQKMPQGSQEPYLIIGSEFEEAKLDDLNAPIAMFKDREDGWDGNYYQGTDPVQSHTGLSKMGSVIMAAAATSYERDGKLFNVPAPVCIHNHRNPMVKENWKQTKLMGIHYANRGQKACPELIEYNQGHSYIQYCMDPWLLCEESLVARAHLPIGYSIGKHPYGIDMKEGVKTNIHRDLSEFNANFAGNVWFREYFAQLKNIEQEEANNGRSIKWSTTNVRRSNDDIVMAMVLAYINMKFVGHGIQPRRIGHGAPVEVETEWVPIMLPDFTKQWVERPVQYA